MENKLNFLEDILKDTLKTQLAFKNSLVTKRGREQARIMADATTQAIAYLRIIRDNNFANIQELKIYLVDNIDALLQSYSDIQASVEKE